MREKIRRAERLTNAWQASVHLRTPHAKQALFLDSPAKRKVIRAGRRGGKTTGIGILAGRAFLAGRRILYAAPTEDQVETFWWEIKSAFADAIDGGTLYKNETKHILELPGTKNRIRAKTAWNADTLRGDFADLLILDEFQLMDEDAWGVVGAPMLLDNNGDAVFIYTPPSLHSRSASKARDPRHAAKLFQRAKTDDSGRWETFHFTSYDNPHNSPEALAEITGDMTAIAFELEIMAEDKDEAAGALWVRGHIEQGRVKTAPDLDRIVVAIDPSATSAGDEAGIIGAGRAGREFYVLEDASVQGSPTIWASAAIALFHKLQADHIVAEVNQGGEMVETVIKQIDPTVRVVTVHASRGKATRAEPIAAIYEPKEGQPTRGHHVGSFPELEDEMCLWVPGDKSPNRMDAMVWAATDLMLGAGSPSADAIDRLARNEIDPAHIRPALRGWLTTSGVKLESNKEP